MHHVPALFLHPSRRLRSLAITVHADLLRAEALRVQSLFYLREVASAEQVECTLGSWCMATRDPERVVALAAQRCWDAHVAVAPVDKEGGENRKHVLDATQMAALFAFVQRALLDPLALHAYLNPVQVPVDVAVPKTIRGRPVPVVPAAAQTRRADQETPARAKGEGEEESEVDRRARLRIGALGALQWILGTCVTVISCFALLRSAQMFTLGNPDASYPMMCSRSSRIRGCGALFAMRSNVPLRMLKALDMHNLAFEVTHGPYFKRCWRSGQVRYLFLPLRVID